MEWKNIYRGLIMGASDVIPGVSGGTIAVLLGIYDRLIASINGLLTKDWKRHLKFLLPLVMGILLAIILLSRLIEWLFAYYPQPTQFFFLGLILGILPNLFRQADAAHVFTFRHILLLLLGAVLCGSLVFLHPGEGQVIEEIHASTYTLFFFSGMLASAAMILPGISGSFMLLVIGVYQTVINAVSEMKLDILVVTAVGIVIGILFMSKLINHFMARYRIGTFAVVIGLVIGSIFVIFPGWPASGSLVLLSILAFAIGLCAAYILGKVEYKQ